MRPRYADRAVSPTTYRDNRCRRTDSRSVPSPSPAVPWWRRGSRSSTVRDSPTIRTRGISSRGPRPVRSRSPPPPTPGSLPPSRALFIPAGCEHANARRRPTPGCAASTSPPPASPTGGVTPRWSRSTISSPRCSPTSPTPSSRRAARRRAEAVVFDQLAPAPTTTLHLPEPTDERAARVAEALRTDCTDGRSLAAWGRLVGASDRTLARRFVDETGMTFSQWRTELRLAHALPLLANGTSVAATSRRSATAPRARSSPRSDAPPARRPRPTSRAGRSPATRRPRR